MERDQVALVVRALGNTVLVLASVAAFVLSWTERNLAAGARGLISFAASIFFVIVFHETAHSWRYLRQARHKETEHHV